MNKGKIVQIIGPVVDAEFTDTLHGIYNALTVEFDIAGEANTLTLEGQQHLGAGAGELGPRGKFRCIFTAKFTAYCS